MDLVAEEGCDQSRIVDGANTVPLAGYAANGLDASPAQGPAPVHADADDREADQLDGLGLQGVAVRSPVALVEATSGPRA